MIDSVKNKDGKSLKTAGAMDNIANTSHYALGLRVTDLNVGDTAASHNVAIFDKLVKERAEKGLKTQLYSCTEHAPGNFSLSAPVEGYWMIANQGKLGGDGFLRWAYDAWVKDPLNDATHNSFEPGDTFMIYPDEKDALNPVMKSSVRLEKIVEGMRDVNKIKMMQAEMPGLQSDIDALYANLSGTVATTRSYLSKEKIADLRKQSAAFKAELNALSQRYITLKESATDVVDSVVIEEKDKTLAIGSALQLHATVYPENLINRGVIWSTSNADIVSVSKSGVVTANKVGKAIISATSVLDETKVATVEIVTTLEEVDPSARVAYYSFDDKTAKDSYGSRDGIVNGAKFETGKAGEALFVYEEGKNVTFESTSGLSESDSWTVSYWVKSTAPLTDRISVVMDKNKDYSADLKMAPTRDAGFHVGKGSGDVLTFAYPFQQNVWYNVTWTQSKTNGLSMYVDGKLTQNNAWTKTNKVLAPIDILGGTGFVGYIDEVKVYNKVLNSSEIASNMLVKGLNLTVTNKNLYINDTFTIETNLISSEEDKTITYTSNNPSIASVDEQGVVTAHKRGSATITVTNKASGYTGTVTINVDKKLTISNALDVYQLPEANLSTIERAPGTDRQYLGQPDMVRTKEGRLITVYPIGHGKGPIVMKISDDNGTTWTEKKDLPTSWLGSQETPTMYVLNLENGIERIMMITACPNWGTDSAGNSTGWNTSYSDDNGETWTEYKHWHSKHADGTINPSVVGMASLVQLKDENGNDIQKWMGVYHDLSYFNYKTYLTFDEDGNEQWSAPEKYLSEYRAIEAKYQMCEIGMFRSPDGKRIVGLVRSQSHNNPATMIYSDDEGETWSKPIDLPGSLAGERHKAAYDPISGRLVITFREIKYDINKNNQFDGYSDWLAGDWVAWVGTYEDLMELNDGQYTILLAEDWANNAKSGDTGYAGIVVLEDGTFIMDSYGHWDKDFSMSWTGSVTNDLCYIKQAKFKLAEIDNIAGLISRDAVNATIAEAKAMENLGYTGASWSAFTTALEKAVATVADNGSTQAQLDASRNVLLDAISNLEKMPNANKELLRKLLIDALKEYNKLDSYTIGVEAFKTAFVEAQKVFVNVNATQEEVDKAVNDLQKAMGGLAKKPNQEKPKPEKPEKPKPNPNKPTNKPSVNKPTVTNPTLNSPVGERVVTNVAAQEKAEKKEVAKKEEVVKDAKTPKAQTPNANDKVTTKVSLTKEDEGSPVMIWTIGAIGVIALIGLGTMFARKKAK